MPKKKIAKKVKSPKKYTKRAIIHTRFIILGLLLVVFLTVSKVVYKSVTKTHVLGASVYLAEDGNNFRNEISSDGNNSLSGNEIMNGSSNNSNSTEGSGTSENSGTGSSTIMVDCVGPDGKHIQVTFEACKNLNEAWNRSQFSFTTLSTPQKASMPETTETVEERITPTSNEPEVGNKITEKTANLLVQTENKKSKVDLNSSTNEVLFEGNNSLKIKIKDNNGSGVELDQGDALEKVNEVLKADDIEVGTNSAKQFVIKKGQVEAATNFSLSVDLATKALTVSTPDGIKTVTVLPDQAVQNVLQKRIMNSIQSQATPTTENPNRISQMVELTTLNNQPVFAIKGVSSKKLLGFIPVSFAKETFVSATTGDIVKTDELFINKVLEAISFYN